MKFLNKLISFILCLVLIVNSSSIVYGAEVIDDPDGVHLYSVPVESNEYLKDSVTFYEFDGKYYLSLEDVKDFTRCTLTEDEEIITLTHGLREIVIDKSSGHMTDSDIVDQGNIILLEYDGKYLCEGIPMLIYLGATCTISEHNKLEVLMPVFTIWESIMPDYIDYYFNINELYGGEDNVKISLICDIIADVLDGVSGHGLMANADTHLEDALYEILNVDMMKYASVQETASAQNQKINDFQSSAVFGTMLDTGDNMYDAVYEALDYYSRFYVSAKNDILLDIMTQTDNLDYASELASQIKKQVYAQSATKANLKNAKKAQSFMDIGMLAFDTAITSYSMMQYNDDTKNLFARTINREMFEYANYYDISWNNVSDKISNTLKSTQSIVANTAIDNVAEFVVEKVTEEGAKTALSAFTSKANIYTAAIQIGSFVASLINYESNQAFSADMNAIWLSVVQYDVAMLVSSLLVKERDEFQFSSAESIEKLKDMFTLYYRTTIAFAENIAKSIEEFGTKGNQKWVPWFSSTTEASVGNYAAAYLYRITNCEIVPIVDFSSLSDDLLSIEWLEAFKDNNEIAIYTQYLLAGGYSELMGYEVRKEYLEVSTCLVDIDNDDIDELLISLMDIEFSGPRGYQTFTALLDIQDNVVKTIDSAYDGGGTIGGDYLVLKYDRKDLKYVLALDGIVRNSIYANCIYLHIYSDNIQEVEWDIVSNYYNLSLDMYAEAADRIRSETSLFFVNGDDFKFYKINDEYVPEDEYSTIIKRFIDPVDTTYQMQLGTYLAPISIK